MSEGPSDLAGLFLCDTRLRQDNVPKLEDTGVNFIRFNQGVIALQLDNSLMCSSSFLVPSQMTPATVMSLLLLILMSGMVGNVNV